MKIGTNFTSFERVPPVPPPKPGSPPYKKHSSKTKPFNCHLCNKIYTIKKILNTHEQTQTLDKPFSCGKCEKIFTLKSYIHKHKESHVSKQNSEPFLHKMTHSHHNQLTKCPSIPIRYCQAQFQPQLKAGLRWFYFQMGHTPNSVNQANKFKLTKVGYKLSPSLSQSQ